MEAKVDSIISIAGNFGDLAAMAEPLERFEGRYCRENKCSPEIIKLELGPKGIWIGTNGCNCWYTLDEATEIHHKLGRLIATVRSQKSK